MWVSVELDHDIMTLPRQEMRRSGSSFRQVVNGCLREALTARVRQTRKPFVVTPRAMGLPAGFSYGNLNELLDGIEGDERL